MSNQIQYPPSILKLVEEFKKLPGVGARAADRLALWSIGAGREDIPSLAQTLSEVYHGLGTCPTCGFFKENDSLCLCCELEERDSQLLCVVEQASDVLPIEKAQSYKGYYHCLGGKLSPLSDIGPEDLNIESLIERIRQHSGIEIILALGSDVEGEATTHYLLSRLKSLSCKVTRLAQGLPAGAMLSYADSLTLHKAFMGRQDIPFED